MIYNIQKNLGPGIIFGYILIGKKKKYSIIPHKHLIKNIGFVKEATHTKIKYKDWYNNLETEEFKNLSIKKKSLKLDISYDLWISKKIFKINTIYMKKKFQFLKKFILG